MVIIYIEMSVYTRLHGGRVRLQIITFIQMEIKSPTSHEYIYQDNVPSRICARRDRMQRVGKRARQPSAKVLETIENGFDQSLQDQNSKQ